MIEPSLQSHFCLLHRPHFIHHMNREKNHTQPRYFWIGNRMQNEATTTTKMLSVNHYLLPFLLFEWICLFCHAANRISLLNGFWLGVMRFPWNCVDSRTFAFGVYSSEANQNSENFQSFKENNQNNCSKCENCFKAVAR